jgi:predicted nucleotidyltransferase
MWPSAVSLSHGIPVLERVGAFFAVTPRWAVSVYLFGSYAEGRAHRESNVDIAVFLDFDTYPSAKERFEAKLRLIAGRGSVLHRNDVDLVVLNDAPPELGAHIVTEGSACTAPTRTPITRTFLERMRRIKLEAMKR